MKIQTIRAIACLLFFTGTAGVGSAQQNPYDIVPRPVEVKMWDSGTFTIDQNTPVYIGGKMPLGNVEFITRRLEGLTGLRHRVMLADSKPQGSISIQVEKRLGIVPAEGYLLSVTEEGVLIVAPSIRGAMNGTQTLFQMLSTKELPKNKLPFTTITDYPRFGWRGMMLDCSRQFFDKHFVMQYIDWMAAHKLNLFHWHLTDDPGWRLEIKAYPDLTEKGAWRGPGEVLDPSYGSGNERYGGYYTQEDVKEVIAYAAARGVDILPAIEVPGHSRAVVVTYPEVGCNTTDESRSVQGEKKNVWCVGRESNYVMLDKIIGEIAELFPFDVIDIAGDEVNTQNWVHCPDCQALMQQEGFTDPFQLQHYFVSRVEKIVEKHGKKMCGFNEILKGGELSHETHILGWQSMNHVVEAVKRAYPTIVMPAQYYYLDMAHTPEEHGHRWASITSPQKVYSLDPAPADLFTEEDMPYILGIEGALWAEYLDRPARIAEYQTYPRLSALSEAAWTPQADRSWEEFYSRLTRSHLQRLSDMGIAFRDFPPVAVFENGTITVIPPYEGAEIRFEKNAEPTKNSPFYTTPIQTGEYDQYQFRTFFGEAFSPPVHAQPAPVATYESDNHTVTINKDITSGIDRSGVWYLSFSNDKGAAKATRVVLYENGRVVSQYADGKLLSTDPWYRFNLPGYDAGKKYTMTVTLQKVGADPFQGSVLMKPAPFQEPAMKITSSLAENPRFPYSNIIDGNLMTYARSAGECKKGDWMLFQFDAPVTTPRIEVVTGMPNQPQYPVTDGHVEYSYDGVNFIMGDVLDYGKADIYPDRPLKAVRLVIDGPNNEPIIAIQDIRIHLQK